MKPTVKIDTNKPEVIKVLNDQTEGAPNTRLAAALASAGTTVNVFNVNGFTDNWNIQIGKTGEEESEIIEIKGAPSGTTIETAVAVVYEHPKDTPVYCLKYDKVIFKRSTAGTAGTAVAMTAGTVTITPDSKFTQFDDTSGTSTYAYKASLYSTGGTWNSSDSDWVTPTGYAFYSLGGMKKRIKDKALKVVSDMIIKDLVNEWREKLVNAAIDVNQDYSLGTVDVAFSGTAQEGTITSSDFKQVNKAEYTEDGTNWYLMTSMEYRSFYTNEDFNATHPYYYTRSDNVIGRKPNANSGTIRVAYSSLGTALANDSDELPFSMRGYTKSFIDYTLSQIAYKDNRAGEGERLEAKAMASIETFKTQITPRHKSGPEFITITDGWGISDHDMY